jgi:hypothetical protein
MPVNTARIAKCLFCDRLVPLRFPTGTVQVDCPVCGSYEVTTGVLGILRHDANVNAAVRAEIRHQLDSGVERPTVNHEFITQLKAR